MRIPTTPEEKSIDVDNMTPEEAAREAQKGEFMDLSGLDEDDLDFIERAIPALEEQIRSH